MADAEAVFDVAKDPGRPFFIDAGDREIRVVGTEFNVLHTASEVRVTVRRGIVEVRPADHPQSPALARLVKGQALEHQQGRPDDVVAAADPDAALAWTEGRLVFQGERLADVAATLNRYVKTPIAVAPDIRDTPVRATLVIGPEADMLASLTAFLPVQSEQRGDRVWLSLRRPTR
jgi:transmembrane sensor